MKSTFERFRHLYPFQSHYLDLGKYRMHYLDEGQGEPIVMLHGNPTWSFMYRRLISALRNAYRVIAPDHVGCGLSDKPPDTIYSYRLEQRVADLQRLLDHLQVNENVTFVLHDWGGVIGMAHAVQVPTQIKRLVLFNTAAFPVSAPHHLHWSIRICRSSRIASFLIRNFNLFAVIASHVGFRNKRMPSDVRRGYLAPYDSRKHRLAILRFVQDIPLEPTHPSFSLLEQTGRGISHFRNTPALICWGGQDFVFNQFFLQEWRKRLPQAEVHQLPEAGHYVVDEAFESVEPAVQSFLRRSSGSAEEAGRE